MIKAIAEQYEQLKADFLEECKRYGIKMDAHWFALATSLTTGMNRGKWQLVMSYNHQGKKKSRTLGRVDSEEVARRLIRLYSAAKHLARARERLADIPDIPA